MNTSAEINEIAKACAAAQLELKPAVKDAMNPAFKSKYADLASVVEAARVYAKHGVCAWQDATLTEGGVAVLTRLAHHSGQWVEFGPMIVPLAKRDAHGVGSATTYAKRYALSAALGIAADEDDDGNAAVGNGHAAKQAPPPVPEGFDDWRDHLDVCAGHGTAALRDAWKAAPTDYREYLQSTAPESLKALKTAAEKVDKKAGVPA